MNLLEASFLKNHPDIRFSCGQADEHFWKACMKESNACFEYSLEWGKYTHEYEKRNCSEWISTPLIITRGGKPIGIWFLCLKKDEKGWSFSSPDVDGYVLAPLQKAGLSRREKKRSYKTCLNLIKDLARAFKINDIHFVSHYVSSNIQLDGFIRVLRNTGAESHIMFGSAIDLRQDESIRCQSYRKSYKSLINKGRATFTIKVVDNNNIDASIFKEVQNFHLHIAGRKTRSDETWNCQLSWIKKGFAILICSYYHGALVGASLFPFADPVAWYQIGIYDRTLFDLPIAHVIQDEAAKYFKSMGLDILYLGICYHPNDFLFKVTSKVYQISKFKEGFSTMQTLHIYQKKRL